MPDVRVGQASTDLVKADGALQSQQEVASQLDALEASGDTQALHKIASNARAFQEYERQQKATERANYYGRVKVMAEARIGSIDVEMHPSVRDGALRFGREEISPSVRTKWRLLAQGLLTGQLDRGIDLAESRYGSVSTSTVVRELRAICPFHVSVAPLQKRYLELRERDGISVAEVGRRAGLSAHGFLGPPGCVPKSDRVMRHVALRVAAVLGVDPGELKNAAKVRKPRKRKVRVARKLSGGRLDETYSLIRKALQELQRAEPGGRYGTEEAWEHLYAAEEIIGKALWRVPTEGRG